MMRRKKARRSSTHVSDTLATRENHSLRRNPRQIPTPRGRAKQCIAFRRAWRKLLEVGATTGVRLGKQLLSQRDVTPVHLTGAEQVRLLSMFSFRQWTFPNNQVAEY